MQRRESKKGEMEEGNEKKTCDYHREKAEEKKISIGVVVYFERKERKEKKYFVYLE